MQIRAAVIRLLTPARTYRFLFPVLIIVSAASAVPAISPDTVQSGDSIRTNAASTVAATTPDSSASPLPDSTKKEKPRDLTDTVRYEADRIEYDADKRILHLLGHAEIKYQTMFLLADTIIYSMAYNLFSAMGRPQLIEGVDTTVGDYMVYNIKTRRGRVRYATTHITDAYFSGQRIVKSTKNELYVDQGDYTTCMAVDTPHYYFYGERIRIIPNDKIISKPVVLNIGNAPVAWLPFMIFPVNRDRKSGLLTPVWGGNPAGGGYVDNIGYYYTPNDFVDFIGRLRVREFSEYVVEAASHYALKYRLNGGISGRYALSSGFLQAQRQWAVDYSHTQDLTPDGLTKLAGSGNLVSAKNFYSDYSQDSSELREQMLKANLSLSRQFETVKGSGSIVWNRSQDLKTNHIVDEIPGINFSLPDRPLIPPPGSGDLMSSDQATADSVTSRWYNSIYWGYGGRGLVRRETFGTGTQKDFIRPGGYNELHISSPQKILKHITVSPNASANMATFYGYMDTAVIGYDTLYDTVMYSSSTIADTGKYPTYKLEKIETTHPGITGVPDTVYNITKIGPPVVNKVHAIHDHSFANVYSWNAGVSMSTNLYGIFPLRIFNFAGIRHTLTPGVSYTFTPKHDCDKTFYPIGIPYETSHLRRQVVSLSLANQFHGKLLKKAAEEGGKPQETKFSILSANLGAQYDFEAKGRKWSDLSLTSGTAYRFLGLNFGSAFWLYDREGNLSPPILRNYSVSLSTGSFEAKGKLWDGDKLLLDSLRPRDPIHDANSGPQNWRVSITPTYSFRASRTAPGDVFVPEKNYSLGASADLGFTRNWKISWSGNYNFMSDQMVQNSINLSCDLECWAMQFQWRPEKLNPGYYFLINIKKVPEIKWEQRDRY